MGKVSGSAGRGNGGRPTGGAGGGLDDQPAPRATPNPTTRGEVDPGYFTGDVMPRIRPGALNRGDSVVIRATMVNGAVEGYNIVNVSNGRSGGRFEAYSANQVQGARAVLDWARENNLTVVDGGIRVVGRNGRVNIMRSNTREAAARRFGFTTGLENADGRRR